MPYRIRKGESVEAAVKRIATEQIDKAIAEISNPELDRHEVVHQVRKRCKKIRGLIRLVRPDFDGYARENAFFRDAAANLSFVRDAQSIIETFDKLREVYKEELQPHALDGIRDQLSQRRQQIADEDVQLEEKLAEFLAQMKKARKRVSKWKIKAKGFDAAAGGLGKSYGRGREAMNEAYAEPTADKVHEWRKRTKYHWYHTRLLTAMCRPIVGGERQLASSLSDLLGDDRDLALLRQTLLESPGDFGDEKEVQTCVGLIDARRKDLKSDVRASGLKLFAEKPKRLVQRFQRYWSAWRG